MYSSSILFVLSVLQVYFINAGPVTERLKSFHTLSSEQDALCPPGVWTCSTGKRSHIPNRQFTAIAVTVQDNNEDNGSKDPAYRSRHILTSRKKKMFKRMLKKRTPSMKGFQASKVVCPPGVWTCSTGKR